MEDRRRAMPARVIWDGGIVASLEVWDDEAGRYSVADRERLAKPSRWLDEAAHGEVEARLLARNGLERGQVEIHFDW